MSDKTRPSSSSSSSAAVSQRQQPSRLQRRAPSSLQITAPSSHWNAAIPLLSPLASSPTSPELIDRTSVAPADGRPREDQRATEQERKPVVFKRWQHPAAPFYYEPAPLKSSFVPV